MPKVDWSNFTKENFEAMKFELDSSEGADISMYGHVIIGDLRLDIVGGENSQVKGNGAYKNAIWLGGDAPISKEYILDDVSDTKEFPHRCLSVDELHINDVVWMSKVNSYDEFKQTLENCIQQALDAPSKETEELLLLMNSSKQFWQKKDAFEKELCEKNKTREFEVTGYYYIEDYEQYLVYCKYDNRTATIGIDEDNLTIRDYQDEDKMLEDFKVYLQKENQQHDIFNLPAIEDLHPITAYLVDEMEKSENNMIFIDEDGFPELEEKFHKPWNQIEAELESDIERFNLDDVLTLVCHEKDGKFVDPEIVAYGDLQCAFTKEVYHPPVEKKEKEHKAVKKKHKEQGFSR